MWTNHFEFIMLNLHHANKHSYFKPRSVRIKKERESPEMDFATRMKMMSKSKATTKTIFQMKE